MTEPAAAPPRRAVNVDTYHVPMRGFTQAVLAPAGGRALFVSGLTARDARGNVLAVGDPAGQAQAALRALHDILAAAGVGPEAVVRTVTYVVDMGHHAAVHEERRKFFGELAPASTTVEVSRLYDEHQLVEIEATAIVP